MTCGELENETQRALGHAEDTEEIGAEFAHRANIHRTYVSMLERRVNNPTLSVIAEIAAVLETTDFIARIGSRKADLANTRAPR